MTSAPPKRRTRLAVEAIAIFAAVFLGFLADDYREFRGDRARERELLEQLLSDLDADSAQLAQTQAPSANRAAALAWIHNNLRRPDVPHDSVVQALSDVQISVQYAPVTFTYSGLKTSGRLDLIRDRELRNELVFYFEDRVPYLEVLTNGVLREEDEWWNLLAPYMSLQPRPALDRWPEISSVDVGEIRSDRSFAWATADFGNWSYYEANVGLDTIERNRSLASLIRGYLAGS